MAIVVVGRGAQAAEVDTAGVGALLGAVRAGANVGGIHRGAELVGELAVHVHAGRGAVVVGVKAGNAFGVGVTQTHVKVATLVAAANSGDVIPGVAVFEGSAGLIVGIRAVFSAVGVGGGAVGHTVAAGTVGESHKTQVASGTGSGDFRVGTAFTAGNKVTPRS